jgi:hypothetical protein
MRAEGAAREIEQSPKYEILDDPEYREQLFHRVDEMLQDFHDRDINSLVFLDKSARPISWLIRELWQTRYPDEPLPDLSFINIGTRGRPEYLDEREKFDSKRSDLEKTFRNRPVDYHQDQATIGQFGEALPGIVKGLQEIFKNKFDHKTVGVVDEYSVSNASRVIATSLIGRAFPKAKNVEGHAVFYDVGPQPMNAPWMLGGGYSYTGVKEEGLAPDIMVAPDHLSQPEAKQLRAELKQLVREQIKSPLAKN